MRTPSLKDKWYYRGRRMNLKNKSYSKAMTLTQIFIASSLTNRPNPAAIKSQK
jgi:hypothetical protein